MTPVRPIPEGFTTVTASLTLRDAAQAIEFYKKAFGAVERGRSLGPGGKIMHAEIGIGSAIVMLADEIMGTRSPQTIGGSPVAFYMYVEDVDAAFAKATGGGAKPTMPVTEMFWGDRFGQVEDPYGYKWSIATRVRDLTPEQIKKGQEEWMKSMAAAAK